MLFKLFTTNDIYFENSSTASLSKIVELGARYTLTLWLVCDNLMIFCLPPLSSRSRIKNQGCGGYIRLLSTNKVIGFFLFYRFDYQCGEKISF